jgi:hypothetical protein
MNIEKILYPIILQGKAPKCFVIGEKNARQKRNLEIGY